MASVLEVTRLYRARLARREARVVAEMLRDWGRIAADLEQRQFAVGELIRRAAEGGKTLQQVDALGHLIPLTENQYPRVWLYQQEQVTALLAQARAEMDRLIAMRGPYLEAQMRSAAMDGAKLAAEQLRVGTLFGTRLSVAAVESIAAATKLGPVADLLAGIDVEGIFADALVRGIARGANPRAVAREVARAVNATKQRTLTIARTEMARAQRQATYDAYDALGVTTWQWLSARDATTCAACWAMDGEPFPAEEEIDDHPNGRCAIVPVVDGEPLAEVPTRDAAWSRLSESDKLRVLGPTRYDLHQQGTPISKFGEKYTDPKGDWGTSIKVTPLYRVSA